MPAGVWGEQSSLEVVLECDETQEELPLLPLAL